MQNDLILNKISQLREKPEWYIGKKNVLYLYMFIQGYLNRQYDLDSTFKTAYEDFSDFVNDYYGERGASGAGWAYVISRNEITEEHAFKVFYELFDKFVESLSDTKE